MEIDNLNGKKIKEIRNLLGFCIPAGLFIGLGVGMIFGNSNLGAIMGLGLEFAAMGFFDYRNK